ncbi:peptidase M20 [Sphingopyxis sp. H038]|uniref:M20/M25/M40 family metallo-hydrolase n=1 Tax=unclassified Sphingopyxis TaxID=2614943 RepID=UPI00073160C8|nr:MULTISPECIES: M20/M25/M40 family metallo-hydrolase [unclassified Sphingopyxis]KTE02735.1 peptidase M20 [Sphingopyxis sp. H012]KTE06478.1 peptidase M20 [Sphingopyxis sp. H093]KTE11294.1 peptidase M20 [Sphingopyxis sp. H053]KTE30777.1 peptidase M20 [Sphingopyxis sp. H080]KTE35784.1 peptidase M20 [Sphingopyxis sp. H038]
MKSLPFAALIAFQLALAPTAQAKLGKAESAMAKTVAAEQDRNLALLEKLVNQNSGSLNLEGVEKVGQMMRAELEPLGFKVEWKPMRDTGRAGHLIATHVGKPDAKRLLLIAHLDTVFEPDSPFQKFVRKGDMGEGPGAGDDKGGMVVIVAALRAMQAAGTLKDANIEIHMTGDEEDSGTPIEKARADLIAAGKRSDVALDFEGLVRDNGADMGSVARRSSDSWTVTATGKSAHSSGIFSAAAGDGAIYELTRIIHRFRTELPEPNLTFNVGLIAGGQQADLDAGGIRATVTGKTNIIAPVAVARGDLRALSPEQIARVKAKMAAIVAEHAPGTDAKIAFDPGGYPSMAPTDGNRALLTKLNGVNRDLGLAEMAPLDPLKRGAGDISFVAADVDGLAGLGPYSTGDHAPGEAVDIPSIARQATRAAILMSRLSAEKR